MRQFLCLYGMLALGLSRVLAADPEVDVSQLPRVPATPPEQALGTFKVKPGFRLELVAAEPLVVDPIAMSFDEDGRLYVVEMRDYSERRPERLGRIRRLEDADGDGRFEKSTVFADGLPWPTAVTCWSGGIFVGATPDILWMKDTNGDGVADEREIIFTGFAADYAPFETNKLNVQALMNSFQWSLDNRIHGATSFSGGKVKLANTLFVREWLQRANANTQRATRNTPPLDLRGRDFSFDPRTLEMRAESGGGQHGMSFDNQGRKFVCSNSDHIQEIIYEDRYASRNPYYTMPSPRVSIAADGPAAEVFRISPDEPWRVLRTQWRVAGLVPGPVEGGGRASGYFTGATGLTIYRGDAYGEDFVGDAFIGDAGGNLVHRKKLRPDGILLRAERPADEQKVEFLASTDNWFRPVQFANAPDGCLYIADMYREVIEHPWSLPPNLKKHLDLNNGNDRGRIYRIVPEKFQRRPPPRLSRASTTELVKLLEHRNGWHRDTAARLLYERQDKSTLPALHTVIANSPTVLGTLHALYTVQGLGALTGDLLPIVITNSSAAIRAHAVRLSEHFLYASPAALIRNSLVALAADPDLSVRFQLALSIEDVAKDSRLPALDRILNADVRDWEGKDPLLLRPASENPWIYVAVIHAVGEDVSDAFERKSRKPDLPGAYPTLLGSFAEIVGRRNRSNEVAMVLEFIARKSEWDTPDSFNGGELAAGMTVALRLAEGLRRGGSSLKAGDPRGQTKGALAFARFMAANHSGKPEERLAAIRLLGFDPEFKESGPRLLSLLRPQDGSGWSQMAFHSAASEALNEANWPQLGAELLRLWPELTPVLRAKTTDLLLKRPERVRALLAVIEKGAVQPEELSIAQQAQLRSHRDAAIREQAVKVLGRPPTPERQSVIEAFQPALSLKGDASNGRKIFQARCATCHKLGSDGHTLGPDLATVKSGGKEKLLVAILDPNREVAPNFLGYAIETKDGESLSGVLASENANSVTLRMAGGVESVIARANIASLQSQGRSLMPEGLEEGLKPQDMADLLEFIVTGP